MKNIEYIEMSEESEVKRRISIYNREHYLKNKEAYAARNKKHYEKVKEARKAKYVEEALKKEETKSEYYTCEVCNYNIQIRSRRFHVKSKRHIRNEALIANGEPIYEPNNRPKDYYYQRNKTLALQRSKEYYYANKEKFKQYYQKKKVQKDS